MICVTSNTRELRVCFLIEIICIILQASFHARSQLLLNIYYIRHMVKPLLPVVVIRQEPSQSLKEALHLSSLMM